ncbi:MAG: putative lipid II flippase FtsW [Oscillospiraceae bacterium]|nr:putative lipid II flippase FtsW [Oscillospiraceae bacterium]
MQKNGSRKYKSARRSPAPENIPASRAAVPHSPSGIEKTGIARKIRRKRVIGKTPESGADIQIKSGVDRPFLLLVIILLCIGTTMVFSASYVYAKQYFDGDSYYFAKRQIIWAVISLIVLFLTSVIPYTFYERFAPWLSAAAVGALALVPIIGYSVKGAKRWINLGFASLQPSEFVKIAAVIFIAWYAVTYPKNIKKFWKGIVFILALLGVVCVLLYKQPHLSAMVIITLITFIMLYLGGAKKLYIILMGIFGSAGLLALMLFTEHGKKRITVWLHPENFVQTEGWQPLQSLYAIGSGGLWGVGLGQSRQKHLYLPEPQNDYIFSILCEEMGFVFAAAVLLLFFLLIWRGYYIARYAPRRFAAMLAAGLTTAIAVQVLLNIAVVTNAVPATGVSLPFFSYGGTSLTIFMSEMGVVLNISRYSYINRN